MLSILPAAAIAAGEIEFLEVDDEAFVEAGLSRCAAPDQDMELEEHDANDDDGERVGWSDSHSAWMMMRRFKKEELL